MRRAVFLDRDGVICQNRHDYVKSWQEFAFLPGAPEAVARLARSDLQIVIVTNQSAINRHLISASIVEDIHRRMVRAINRAGGRVDLVTYCPHRPDEACGCRKPRPGLLVRAAQELQLDLGRSYLVGDAASDVLAGKAVGCRSYRVLTGRGVAELPRCCTNGGSGFSVANDLSMAVDDILRHEQQLLHRVGFAGREQGLELSGSRTKTGWDRPP